MNAEHGIEFARIWAMPNRHTFDIKPIKELLKEEVDLSKTWLDPFANKNKLATVTNDLSMEFDTDYHMDALEFLQMYETGSIQGGVLYDPPYSVRQISECYKGVGRTVTTETTQASFWANIKKEIARVTAVGAKVISFGWNSGGIGRNLGFEMQKILLVPHGGPHNDTICTIEVKMKNV